MAASHRPQRPTVLFDLDGTVWDSIDGITSSLAHALEALGLPVPERSVLASNVGPPLRVMLSHFGVTAELLDRGVALYRRCYARHGEYECTVFPGMEVLLRHLRQDGFAVGAATAKSHDPTMRMLAHFGLLDCFEVVATSPMDGRFTDKIEIVAEALSGLVDSTSGATGSEPGSDGRPIGALVGDRHYDVTAGRHHGLATIAVDWGYAPPGELSAAAPDIVVGSVDELDAVIRDPLKWDPALNRHA